MGQSRNSDLLINSELTRQVFEETQASIKQLHGILKKCWMEGSNSETLNKMFLASAGMAQHADAFDDAYQIHLAEVTTRLGDAAYEDGRR